MSTRALGPGLLRSARAATLSQLWRYGVAFATRIVLRRGERLVTAAGWGLWHWTVDSVFGLLAQVRDLGLPAQVVRLERRPYANFLAVEALWGGLLGAAVAVAAPWIAGAFPGAPAAETAAALRLLVVFFLCEGAARVPLTFFEARLALDRTLAPEIARNLCWATLSILLAWLGQGASGLLAAHVVATALFALLLWRRARADGMALAWEAGATWPLVRAGLPLMALALLYLALGSAGFLILGARFDAGVVGRFGAAFELAWLVSRVLELPLRRPLYPALVALRSDGERQFATYRLASVLLVSLQVLAAGVLFAGAEVLLVLLFDEPYRPAAAFLRLLCLTAALQPLGRCGEDLLLARGEERVVLLAVAANVASLGGLGLVLAARLGAAGVAWAHLLPVGELALGWAVWRASPAGFRRLARDLAFVYLLAGGLFAAALCLAGPGEVGRFGAALAAALLAAALLAWRFHGEFRTLGRALARRPNGPQ